MKAVEGNTPDDDGDGSGQESPSGNPNSPTPLLQTEGTDVSQRHSFQDDDSINPWHTSKTGECIQSTEYPSIVKNQPLDLLTTTFQPSCLRAWSKAKETQDTVDSIRKVANRMEMILHDASPLSPYSADSKSIYWRSLARNYPGIISFCCNLDNTERTLFFSLLVKLHRFQDQTELHERALDDVIEESRRSHILYSLLSTPEADDSLINVLESLLTAKKQAGLSTLERNILPKSIVAYADFIKSDSLASTPTYRKNKTFQFSLRDRMQEKKLSRAKVVPSDQIDPLTPAEIEHQKAIEPFEKRENYAVEYLNKVKFDSDNIVVQGSVDLAKSEPVFTTISTKPTDCEVQRRSSKPDAIPTQLQDMSN
uniref:Uncharacterized protein n=1 Tax=Aureoumbra lagunensis TaxID=44058 RepID=A0A7S3K7B8_9STRA